MRIPVGTGTHKGKLLEIDTERETIALIAAEGRVLGQMTWEAVIDHIQATCRPLPPVPVRQHPRVRVSVAVRYRVGHEPEVTASATGIGAGGLFIECPSPLPTGTTLSMEFALPDSPDRWLTAIGVVAWICERPDQYQFEPGMGVKFTEIADEARERITGFVNGVLERHEA